jgi:hypothetical protein
MTLRHMDAIIEYLWSRQRGIPMNASDWAVSLLEAGRDSPAIRQLTDRHLPDSERERLTQIVIDELGRAELRHPHILAREYERASIGDYFAGELRGWDLIQRCCDLHWVDENDDPDREFWIALAEDAGQHGGQGICIDYDFITTDFDTALRSAILKSGRPLPKTMT